MMVKFGKKIVKFRVPILIAGEQCFLSGMSAIVTDTKELAERETPLYVLIAVVLAMVVLGLTMESFFVPVLLRS